MSKYKYTAHDLNGKVHKGVIEARDEQSFYARMRTDGLYLEKHSEVGSKERRQKLKPLQLSDFCRQMGTLLQAGVTLARALSIASRAETLKQNERAAYEMLLRDVREGVALSEAMENQSPVFPELLSNMIRSAEASGSMDQVMLRMGIYYEKMYRTNKKVKGAMRYPSLLFFMIIGVFIFIVTYLLPQFEPLFARMGELPATTQLLLDLSNAFRTKWALILIVAAAVVTGVIILSRLPKVKFLLDKLKLHLPVVGKMLKVIYTARFSRTLSSLYSSGLPIIRALAISGKTIGNVYIEKQFDDIVASVREGGSLSQALLHVDGFVRKLSDAVLVGEETGNLDSMLTSTAEAMEYESEMSIDKLVGMLEPAMIIMIAAVIGFVLISVLLPVFQYYNSIETMSYT